MPTEQTLLMVKPGFLQHEQAITEMLVQAGLSVKGRVSHHLTSHEAGVFYAEHQGKPFYDSLTQYMSSEPLVALLVEGPNAVQATRALVGATDPAKAAEGTIRKRIGQSMGKNGVHASDSPESAARELKFWGLVDAIEADMNTSKRWEAPGTELKP